uniref:Uncharacterized protein n=1 Tax=Rhizophora mucronata TaxID=61149 RepID=A0A2P2NTM3_RHIMU
MMSFLSHSPLPPFFYLKLIIG